MKPLIEHLEELRSRLIVVLVFLGIFFVGGVALSRYVIERLQEDIIVSSAQLIVLSPLEYFIVSLKTGAFLAILLTMPVLVFEILAFLKPALNKRESALAGLVFPSFVVLFIAGIVFAYFIFLPLTIYFLAPFAPQIGAANMWSLDRFVVFVFITILSTALVFEIPLVMIVLSKLGIISRKWLKAKRKYVYVAIFIVAAVITPGVDVVTQTIVALPMILLYELGILLLWLFRY